MINLDVILKARQQGVFLNENEFIDLRLITICNSHNEDDNIGYEWELNIKDKSTFKRVRWLASVEIRPSIFSQDKYEVYFSDKENNVILGKRCLLKEANSRASNAIEEFKRHGRVNLTSIIE